MHHKPTRAAAIYTASGLRASVTLLVAFLPAPVKCQNSSARPPARGPRLGRLENC